MNGWTERLRDDARLGAARERLLRGERVLAHGLSGPARLLLPLLLSEEPLLVVVPRERDVEGAAQDLRTLAAEVGLVGLVLPFPAPGPLPYRGLPRNPEASLQRAAALHALRRGRARALVASPLGLLRPSLAPRLFETRVLSLRVGEEMTPEILLEALDEGGYTRQDPVTSAGQVARRGGIIDVFPPDQESPLRLEFLGDEVESLRRFDPETQRTTATVESFEVLPLSDVFATRSVLQALRERLPARFPGHRDLPALVERMERGLAAEELPELVPLAPEATVAPWDYCQSCRTVLVEPDLMQQELQSFLSRAQDEYERAQDLLVLSPAEALVSLEAFRARLGEGPGLEVREIDLEERGLWLSARPVRRHAGDLRALLAELRHDPKPSVLFLGNAGRADRLRDVIREDGQAVGEGTDTLTRVGSLSTGFELLDPPLRVLADGDIFPEEVHLHRPRGRGARSFLSDLRELKPGDLVVHQDHGISRFEGLETIEVAGIRQEYLVLSYHGGDKLKVPVVALDRVEKFTTGGEVARPALDKLGSGRWDKVKKRVKKAMRDMAQELLKLYAERKARPGHAFTSESPWLKEFEEAFEYDETPDQAQAIKDVARDMASETPMDRLVCGDVGYGKTEVAMRAAMRAVLDGKQVAVLSPTTVLAFQHWKTFRKRFAPFPVKVEMVSRFRANKDIKQVLENLAAGQVDILIGTHRLLSRDVEFKDLGLLVIDEEQRFGVAAKEKLKQLRTTVDSLTLSATPIPRTLQMGLAGIRDMSVIETPPRDRLAIQTSVVKFSTDVIAAAIRQELGRDGQVYLVHNRVESIYSFASMVQKLVPEAKVVVGHGQLPEKDLEKAMLAFVEGRADVLVATTIIENGIDIPRANTMVINRADRYGLAQLYQLRGRVGRSDQHAFAYLLVPPDKVLSEIARKRLAAIREFSDLGAGFRIAALDLELRGAGNLLGGEQSGHIEAIGLDLYIKLLEQTVLELKGQPVREAPRATLNLRVDLRVPTEYVPDADQRIALYKRVSQLKHAREMAPLGEEIRDRYGPPPPEVHALLRYAELRLRAEALGIQQVDAGPGALHLRFSAEGPPIPQLVDTVRRLPGASLTPQGVLRLPQGGVAPLQALERALSDLEAAAVPATPAL